MTIKGKLKAPYAYFGSKRFVAPIIWKAFGKVDNYVEPFFGSLSILLANPAPPKIETVNDIDAQLCNFWRAISKEPERVALVANFPVSELDLHARHRWIIENSTNEFILKLDTDPDFYDVKMAGYWIYGQCASVGNNWLNKKGLQALPLLSSAGGGIHGLSYNLNIDLKNLQSRVKRVRICCGDWKRILSPSILYNNVGINSKKSFTAVMLDPPYDLKNRDKVYKQETNIFRDVCQWAIDNDHDRLRIAVCGYDGDFKFPDTWVSFRWKANGGMANLGDDRGKINSQRETIWFSPNCLEIK